MWFVTAVLIFNVLKFLVCSKSSSICFVLFVKKIINLEGNLLVCNNSLKNNNLSIILIFNVDVLVCVELLLYIYII